MRKTILITLLALTLACQPVTEPDSPPTITPLPLPSATASPAQPTVYLSPTPGYPEEGFGPVDFPTDINPLTGLSTDPAVLNRRPMLIKVSNLPREVRPQSGLSRADIVYEYYTEQGTTRFIAIYYGQEAQQVGSIRSARFFDEHIVRMYRGFFVFGSGDERVRERLYNSNFADRLIVEWQAECPALCRSDPLTNYLFADTVAVREYIRAQGIPDERQGLQGMRFQLQAPDGGQSAERVFAWYSAVIYNRWDYDPPSGRYYRYVDVENYYFGIISSDGYYAIGTVIGGTQSIIGENMQPSDAVNTGYESNRIRFDCVGSTLSLYVNGKLVQEETDSSFTSGDVGLMAGTFDTAGAQIAFDNFVVSKP